jgi:metal-dependent amidase/aminoacylase/carboxypeptidase family protein
MSLLERLVGEAERLAAKAAEDTGCRVKITEPGPAVTTFRRNRALEELFAGLFEERGRTEPAKTRSSYGSTDLANVSQVVPTIEPMVKASDFPIHTEGFARDAVGPGGERALLDGVYFLAAAAARLMTDSALLERVRADFRTGSEDAPRGAA